MFSWERGPIGHRAGRPNTLGTICRPSSAFAACPTSIGTNRGVRHMKANRKLTKCDSGMARVTARTSSGAEVMLRRTTQTVGIPAFEFGVFCDKDCGFHAGPDFNFGGRVHSNGNLFVAEGNGNILTLSDRVTVYGEVVRTNIMNGLPLAAGSWTGRVDMTTSPGSNSYRALGVGEGSVNGMPPRVPSVPYTAPSNKNGNWPAISKTSYNSALINGLTGAKKLSLPIELLTKNKLVPGQPVDIIHRPLQADDAVLLGERYFSQASLKVLLSETCRTLCSC